MKKPRHTYSKGDAYLQWAAATEFAHFQHLPSSAKQPSIALLVEWTNAALENPSPLHAALAPYRTSGELHMAAVYEGLRIASLVVSQRALAAFADKGALARYVQSMELASPVHAQTYNTPPVQQAAARSKAATAYALDTHTLIGVVDDGCPFANAALMASPTSTRLWRLWDQNADSKGVPLGGQSGQPPDANFAYGSQWSQAALNAQIAASPGDESAVYERMGLQRLRRGALHGAHVLDVLAGPVPVDSRVSASRDVLRNVLRGQDGSASAAPTWRAAPAGDAARTSPIVFVQLPQACIDDPSGRWLGHNVLDGLHYIAQCAGPHTKRVVVNLSWGPQTGPHDGSSLLERAIDALVLAQSALGREFVVVVAAGNSYAAQAHALVELGQGAKDLQWHVPPGSDSPAFLEFWWPQGTAVKSQRLTLHAPDGTALTAAPGVVTSTDGAWRITTAQHSGRNLSLVALAPTARASAAQAVAPHGVWRLDLPPNAANTQAVAHVYLARVDHNMGAKRRGRNSYLLDPAYDPFRWLRASETDAPASQVKRAGTISGLATGLHTVSAAGYIRAQGTAARYSSAGPAQGAKTAPDWALPTDESRTATGVLASGVRSGSVLRLVGTSTGAPQLARLAVNGGLSAVTPPHSAPRDDRVGAGCL